MTGLFPITLTATTGLAGAPLLTLNLAADPKTRQLNGHAVQSNPSIMGNPTKSAVVWGGYSTLLFKGAPVILLHLDGNPSGKNSMIAETFHLSGTLGGWSEGTCTYTMYDQTITDAKLTYQPAVPFMPIHPLYAVSMQSAVESGEVGQMKTLLAQAEQHLTAMSSVEEMLPVLKAEIKKLQG